MSRLPAALDRPGAALAVLGLASSALIGGAWFFELAVGLQPCKLCLVQRMPHYGVMTAAAAVFLPQRLGALRRAALWTAAALMAAAVAAAANHVGVEQGWWLGPSDCGGKLARAAADVGDFLKQLGQAKVVSCTEAAWRFLGLSMAGWNAALSAAALALSALVAARGGFPNKAAPGVLA